MGIGTDGAGGGTDVGEEGCSAWSWGRTLETAGTIAAFWDEAVQTPERLGEP